MQAWVQDLCIVTSSAVPGLTLDSKAIGVQQRKRIEQSGMFHAFKAGMKYDLSNKRVAILVADGFEQSELLEPREALDEAGAKTVIVSLKAGSIQGMKHMEKGEAASVDMTLDEAEASEFDALFIPGGLYNPDSLRMDKKAVAFARAFFDAGKPVAAICHGPQVLIEADVVRGRRMTSWPAVRSDLINAGAEWVDEPVVIDQGFVTSRKPDDIPDFNAKMLEEIAEGVHAGQHA